MYLKIHVFLILAVTNSAFSSVEDQWNKFKLDFYKTYDTDAEKHAFEVFKTNLEEIKDHNRLYEKGIVTYKKGITKFADLSKDEFVKIYQLRQGALVHYENYINVTSNATEYLNWKDRGAVTRVKDQGKCGACWIFSAIGVIEGYYFRKNNTLITLSEQNMVDCLAGDNCKGGYPPRVVYYLEQNLLGINTEKDYPFKETQGVCRYRKSKQVKLGNFDTAVTVCTEDELKTNLEKYGPIGIALSANGDWRLYDSGVWFEKSCSYEPNHAILLVGYGTENGRDYWLIKNSYGKDWGLNGYIKIARNLHKNYCGLESYAMYITS